MKELIRRVTVNNNNENEEEEDVKDLVEDLVEEGGQLLNTWTKNYGCW